MAVVMMKVADSHQQCDRGGKTFIFSEVL